MHISKYRKIQNIAKNVHEKLKQCINPQSTEFSIVSQAKKLLREFGITDTWYYNTPVLVLLGGNSCLSISGKDYRPNNEQVGDNNLITVDISPMLNKIWGDCARSYVVENGQLTADPEDNELSEGLLIEQKLHEQMIQFVNPKIKFKELYEFANDLISNYGYENLDFLNNLGHSIEILPSDRRFIDRNCHELLGQTKLFTFEPHIKRKNGRWGFKHENIYYFNSKGKATEL